MSRVVVVTGASAGIGRATPGVAARAIAHAMDQSRRRERRVGTSTVATILANRVAPGLLDRYLASTGFVSQQADDLQPAGSGPNLWEPADGEDGRDRGARGTFDDRSTTHSPQQWAAQHVPHLSGLAAAVRAVGLVPWVRRGWR